MLRYGLATFSLGLAVQYLRSEGFRGIERRAVQQEIEYLADSEKGFLKAADKAISPENKQWFTTAKGRDYLAEQGVDE